MSCSDHIIAVVVVIIVAAAAKQELNCECVAVTQLRYSYQLDDSHSPDRSQYSDLLCRRAELDLWMTCKYKAISHSSLILSSFKFYAILAPSAAFVSATIVR